MKGNGLSNLSLEERQQVRDSAEKLVKKMNVRRLLLWLIVLFPLVELALILTNFQIMKGL